MLISKEKYYKKHKFCSICEHDKYLSTLNCKWVEYNYELVNKI